MQGNKSVKNSNKKSVRRMSPSPCSCYHCGGESYYEYLIKKTRCRKKYFKYPKQELENEILSYEYPDYTDELLEKIRMYD